MARVLRVLVILRGELYSLPASFLAGVNAGLSLGTETSVERERIVREIARIENEIAKLKRLELAA